MESRLRALEQVLAPIAKAFKQWEKSSSSGGGNLSCVHNEIAYVPV